jgi:hypothetical protein
LPRARWFSICDQRLIGRRRGVVEHWGKYRIGRAEANCQRPDFELIAEEWEISPLEDRKAHDGHICTIHGFSGYSDRLGDQRRKSGEQKCAELGAGIEGVRMTSVRGSWSSGTGEIGSVSGRPNEPVSSNWAARSDSTSMLRSAGSKIQCSRTPYDSHFSRLNGAIVPSREASGASI